MIEGILTALIAAYSFVSANRFVVMEGSVLVGGVRERERSVFVGVVREREREAAVEGIQTGLIAAYRRTFTLAKWERGKKVFD